MTVAILGKWTKDKRQKRKAVFVKNPAQFQDRNLTMLIQVVTVDFKETDLSLYP